MNALTRTFVILMVIFSITFTMMSVQFAASIPNWREQAESWYGKAMVTDTYNRNLIAAKVAESIRSTEERNAALERERGLRAELETVQASLDDANNKRSRSESDAQGLRTTVKRLTEQLAIAQASAEKAREKRLDLENRNIELEKRNVDLNDALNERITTIYVLDQQVRQQEQSIILLKQERDKLLKKLNLRAAGLDDSTVTLPTDKVRAASRVSVSPIRGKVMNVQNDHAVVSVGSDDGVEVGMTFIIYNDASYLGDLVITDVEPQSAAGRLENVAQSITAGDYVADERGYLAMN